MSDVQYFNFPIELLKDLFNDKVKTLNNILYYALYAHSLKLEQGNEQYDHFIAAASFYGVSLGGNTEDKRRKFKAGKVLYESIDDSSPKAGFNISIFWDYYKNDKSHFDLACLAAFLAIKSILVTKPYQKVTNNFLWARMCGYRKKIDDISELSIDVVKYTKEYQINKIKQALADWGLISYGHYTRGFYVSFKLRRRFGF